MLQFIGEYESTVDAKGRFLLPVGFKKQLPEGDSGFVINRGFEKCLTLYPNQSWAPIFQKISALNEFDSKVREFRRFFFNGATPVEPDTAGRILLPKNLMEYASIKKDIVLVSAIDKIEIWDKQKHKEFFDSLTSESFSRLANDVMGDKPGDFLKSL